MMVIMMRMVVDWMFEVSSSFVCLCFILFLSHSSFTSNSAEALRLVSETVFRHGFH